MSESREGPPIFGEHPKRWSVGSHVVAHWWESDGRGGWTEAAESGQVVGLAPGGPEGWRVTVTFGPLLDLALRPPEAFNPSQIEVL